MAFIGDTMGTYNIVTSIQPLQAGFSPDAGGQASILLLGADKVVYWNGLNSDGQIVKGGIYYIKVEVGDPFGKVTAFTEAVNVLRAEDPVSVEIYNSAGELVRSLPAPGGYQSVGLKASQNAFAPGPGAAPLTISFENGSSVNWDGKNSAGDFVSSGNYQIKVRSAKTKLDYAVSISVIRAVPDNALEIVLEENPHRAALGPFRFKIKGTVSVTQFSGRLYGVSGELVDTAVSLGGGWLGFSKGAAGGIYFLDITLVDQGVTRHLVKKVALLN